MLKFYHGTGKTCAKMGLCLRWNIRLRALATAMAESMAATARMSYNDFVTNQFRYNSGP